MANTGFEQRVAQLERDLTHVRRQLAFAVAAGACVVAFAIVGSCNKKPAPADSIQIGDVTLDGEGLRIVSAKGEIVISRTSISIEGGGSTTSMTNHGVWAAADHKFYAGLTVTPSGSDFRLQGYGPARDDGKPAEVIEDVTLSTGGGVMLTLDRTNRPGSGTRITDDNIYIDGSNVARPPEP
jgi:hypothetical protein